MEHGRTGLKPVVSLNGTLNPYNSAPKLKDSHEKIHKDSVFIDTKEVGVDLMSATYGEDITEDNLHALQYRGHLDYSTDEIFNSYFDDLEDFNNVVRESYLQHVQDTECQKQQILSEVAEANLPENLFKVVKFVFDESRSRKIKRKTGKIHNERDIGVIENELVDDDLKVTRYTKYMLAKKMLTEARENIAELRLVGIALGIFIEGEMLSGKKVSSFQSEIHKASNYVISPADVEIAAEGMGWFDFIYPEYQEKRLSDIKKAATEPIIIPIKDKQKVYSLTSPDVWIDTRFKQLLIGETAMKTALESEAKKKSIHKLGELLVRDSVDYRLGELNPYLYREWDRQEYIKYGKWLFSIIEPYDGKFNSRLIAKARKLDLGPGIEAIANKKIFDDLPDFYRALDLKARPRGRFGHWELDDWVNWANKVAEESGGKITRDVIVARSQKDLNEPTWKMMMAGVGNITNLVEAMGRKPYHKQMSFEECVQLGIEFVQKTGRLPEKTDFRKETILPSLVPIYKYCGGIVSFRKSISEALQETYTELAA